MSVKSVAIALMLFFTVLVGGFFVFNQQTASALTKDMALSRMTETLNGISQPSEGFSGTQVLIRVPSKKINFLYAKGNMRTHEPLTPQTPFLTASIGKLFTAVTVGQLVDEGKIRFDTPISTLIPNTQLDGLFTLNGTSYASKVTIDQLLSHTSGIADYFEDPVSSGEPFIHHFLNNPQEQWTPEKLLQFTQAHMSPLGKPGGQFHYSDTGYILLGQIIERIEGKPLHQVFKDRFFAPLNMKHSYLSFGGEPTPKSRAAVADAWISKVEISQFQSLSADWAGGGIVSTLEELDHFQVTLHKGHLLSPKSYQHLFNMKNEFRPGIHYGYGTMEIHFEEFSFLLKSLPKLKGHIGILSTHLYYDPATGTSLIMNLGSDAKMESSYRAIIDLLLTLNRIP